MKQALNYNSNTLTINTADFTQTLKSVPRGTGDLILTDPPYVVSKKTGFKSVGKKSVERFAVSMDFGKWDREEIDLNRFARLSYTALKEGGTIICFYDLWKITNLEKALKRAGFKMIRLIIWEKTNPVPLNSKRNYLTNAREIAVLGVKVGKPTFNSEYDNGIYSLPIHREKRIHPTQKPLKLMEALIKKHSNAGDLVIDCFLGSGTVGIASVQLNRRFLGGDKSAKYIKKAKQRFNSQFSLKASKASKAKA